MPSRGRFPPRQLRSRRAPARWCDARELRENVVRRVECDRPRLIALRTLATDRFTRRVIRDGGCHQDDVRIGPRERLPGEVPAVGVSTTSMPAGGATDPFARRSVTSAPRRLASSARAIPIRPDERLPRKRTESSGSRVPPAVTRTRLPASSSALLAPGLPESSGSAPGWPPARPSDRRPTLPRPARPIQARRARRPVREASLRSPASPGVPTCERSSPARRGMGPEGQGSLRHDVVGEAVGEFRQRVRRKRRDSRAGRPDEVRVELAERLPARQPGERLGVTNDSASASRPAAPRGRLCTSRRTSSQAL